VKRRVIAAVTAVVLAALAGVLVLTYVNAADRRAMADLEPVAVLVAIQAVPEGASGDGLAASVEVRRLPRMAVAPGVADELADLYGLVATTALQPGEQVLLGRFADPAVLAAAEGFVVPEGLQQVALQLEPERALNGNLAAGATVAVFLSSTEEDTTQLALHQVLVTAVQGGTVLVVDGDTAASAPPTEGVTVTLALDVESAARVVFAAEYGSIWLSAEPAEAPTASTPVMTKENLHS
jgi:pilus assembly protein CpaB